MLNGSPCEQHPHATQTNGGALPNSGRLYRQLETRQKELIEQKLSAEEDFRLYGQNPTLYQDEQIASIRTCHRDAGAEIEAISRELRTLLEADPELALSIEREQQAAMRRFARTLAADDNLGGELVEDEQQPVPDPWPVLADEALHGLAGDIARALDPYTEADKVATLTNILTAFGCCINAAPHAKVQHDCHPARLFVVQVGQTSKGRKGTRWSTPHFLLSRCDPDWTNKRIKSGLSSGEGLIYNVRDAVWEKDPVKEKGRIIDYQDVEVDPGESDKRLLVIEPEFASTLTVMARDGSILSAVLRQAWDDGNLSPLTRNNPIKATGAHIGIIGHITKSELLARLDDTSKANGFANRFLWMLVRRSKELPEGGAVPDGVLEPLIERLTEAISFARTVGEVRRDDAARALAGDLP